MGFLHQVALGAFNRLADLVELVAQIDLLEELGEDRVRVEGKLLERIEIRGDEVPADAEFVLLRDSRAAGIGPAEHGESGLIEFGDELDAEDEFALVELLIRRVGRSEAAVLVLTLEIGLEDVAILLAQVSQDDGELDRLTCVEVGEVVSSHRVAVRVSMRIKHDVNCPEERTLSAVVRSHEDIVLAREPLGRPLPAAIPLDCDFLDAHPVILVGGQDVRTVSTTPCGRQLDWSRRHARTSSILGDVPTEEPISGRTYAPAYRVSGRADLVVALEAAVQASGGQLIATSSDVRTPVHLSVELPDGERIGLLAYPFRCSTEQIRGRAADEHRFQIRYGSEESWVAEEHPVGRDPAGVDVTVLLGVHISRGVLIGLDPLAYDPLPMGISFEFKEEDVVAIEKSGWHVWERMNRPGRRRATARVDGLETVVGFRPERLLDFVRFERQAASFGLDPPLRFRLAEAAGRQTSAQAISRHLLEDQFGLSAEEILDIISERRRLAVAVRGGVAERHLERLLEQDPDVVSVTPIDEDGRPDFEIELRDGQRLLVECKNASPRPYADGAFKVEVQKTRATQGDPYGRLYRVDQFDVVAACLFAPTGEWTFRFRATADLEKHKDALERIAPYQRIDDSWSASVADAV